MSLVYEVNTEDQKQCFLSVFVQLDQTKNWLAELKEVKNARTIQQNSSLFKYFTLLAAELNDAGYSYKNIMNRRALVVINSARAQMQKMTFPSQAMQDAVLQTYNKIESAMTSADLSWNKDLVLECMWRPVQISLTNKKSTTSLTTVEMQTVYNEFDRFMSTEFGCHIAWPSKKSLIESQRAA